MAADDVAIRQGLRPGMPLAKAQVLVPGLRIENADPTGDIDALERLAFWALRYSPVVAADVPDGIVLDVEGAAHLLGGDEGLARDLHARLSAASYTCQIGIADTCPSASSQGFRSSECLLRCRLQHSDSTRRWSPSCAP
nr:hypothetical protein [Aquibium carbonis]